jgi:hypothetical protein
VVVILVVFFFLKPSDSFQSNPPHLVEDPLRFILSGVIRLKRLFIFFHAKENEPKESARVPRILRVVDTAGARGNSPRLRQGYGGTQTGPRALIRPHRRCSARDKGDNVNIIKAR